MTDADFLWKLLAGLSLLGNFALLARQFFGGAEKREISPDPLNVREADRFVTEKELRPVIEHLETHDEDIERLGQEIRGNYNTLMRSEAEGRSRLHEKINHLAEAVASVQAIVEPLKNLPQQLSRDIGRIEGAIQRRE